MCDIRPCKGLSTLQDGVPRSMGSRTSLKLITCLTRPTSANKKHHLRRSWITTPSTARTYQISHPPPHVSQSLSQGRRVPKLTLLDRMPTVSAAKALHDLNSPATRSISTGLRGLDCALQNREAPPLDAASQYGGVSRGQVTEVYGPPGVGKTAFG
jgi:hypothetical protein